MRLPGLLLAVLVSLPAHGQDTSSVYRPERVDGTISAGAMDMHATPPGPRLNLKHQRVVWITLASERVDPRQRLPLADAAELPAVVRKAIVFFGFDSAVPLNPEVIDSLAIEGTSIIRIIGRTDDVGSARYNKKLSQRRASAVAALIEARGVSAARIIAEGRGKSDPIGGKSDEGRALNRQAETVIEVTP